MYEGRASVRVSHLQGLVITSSLRDLMRDAYAKADRSRQKWHMARLTSSPDVAARFQRQMLKHRAIAHYLDADRRSEHEPG